MIIRLCDRLASSTPDGPAAGTRRVGGTVGAALAGILLAVGLTGAPSAAVGAEPTPRSAVDPAKVRAWNRDAFERYEAGDTARALVLYRRAAQAGDPSAQYNLAVIRIRGESRTPSFAAALAMLRASATAGFAPAQYMLGAMYESGRGVPASQAQATTWYEKAAEQGMADAQTSLATQYYLGRGVTQDFAAAARWYERAAGSGDVGAQYLIASMYHSGLGVTQDLQSALDWYSAAARQGDDAARLQARQLAERIARDRDS